MILDLDNNFSRTGRRRFSQLFLHKRKRENFYCCRIKSLNFSFVFGLTTATISDRDDYRRKTVPEMKHTNITRDVVKLHEEMRSTVSDDGCRSRKGRRRKKTSLQIIIINWARKAGSTAGPKSVFHSMREQLSGFTIRGTLLPFHVSPAPNIAKKKTVAECAITRDT